MDMRNYFRWIRLASGGNRTALAVYCSINIIRALLSLAFIWCTKVLVDIATGHSGKDLTLFLWLCIGAMVLQTILSPIASRLSSRTEIRIRNRLRYILFIRTMESTWQGRNAMHTGDIMNRIESDVSSLTSVVCRTIPSLATVVIQLLAAIYLMASMDLRILVCTIFLMPAALALSKRYFRRIRTLNREILDSGSKVQAHMQENIQHKTLITTMEMVPEISRQLSSGQKDLERQVMQKTDYSLFSRTVIQAGFAAGYLTVFVWCIFGLLHGTMTFGTMTAFLQLVSQIQKPIVDIGRMFPAMVQASSSAERLSEVYDLPQERHESDIRFNGKTGIRLQDISFAYKDGHTGNGNGYVIEGLSHDFRPGSITAITGATGAGKSTIIRLILALVHPDKGEITFYNNEMSAQASADTRCNVTYIPQGNSLISGTIRTNLLLGNPDASEQEMRTALHNAVADFVLDLTAGLDTVCSESGSGLSEGQAQRIAIARGLLRPGKILLMDEPTSALDHDTEQTLLSRLAANRYGKTIIIVSHSHSVEEFCDDVIRI